MNIIQHELKTPDGPAELESIYVTELGYIMARVYYKQSKRWVTYRVSTLEDLLKNTDLSITGNFLCKRI